MSHHSTAPWEVDNANLHLIAQLIDGRYKYIANFEPSDFSVTERSEEEVIANAQLGAAAPELLSACKRLLAAAKCGYEPRVALLEYGQLAENAIAKAEGRFKDDGGH